MDNKTEEHKKLSISPELEEMLTGVFGILPNEVDSVLEVYTQGRKDGLEDYGLWTFLAANFPKSDFKEATKADMDKTLELLAEECKRRKKLDASGRENRGSGSLSKNLIGEITLLAGISESEADLFFEIAWEGYKDGKKGNALWNYLKDHYSNLTKVSKSDKDALLKLLKSEIRKKSKEWRQRKEVEEFDLNKALEEAIEEAKTPKHHSPIGFDHELGLFFVAPIEIKKTDPLLHYKPLLHDPSTGFATKSKGGEHVKEKNGGIPPVQQQNGLFATPERAIEGLLIYLQDNQKVQILQAALTQRKTGKIRCKLDTEELGRHLAIEHASYFKMEKNIETYLISCWSIGTYLFPMFPIYPYLFFTGEKGTNKSGQLTFLGRICWNATSKLAIPTEASLFRMIHYGKPTQLIDEAHRQLNHPVYGALLYAVLETGHERGGRVPRNKEHYDLGLDFFDTYCPKALATREELELEEKGITIRMLKSFDRKYAIARKSLEISSNLDTIQEAMLFWALANWDKVYEVYQEITPTPHLTGRYFLLWAPILAICKVVFPDKYDEMIEYAEEAIKGTETKSYEREIQILGYFVTHLDEIKARGNGVVLKEIEAETGIKWQGIPGALRNLGLIKRKKQVRQGMKYYLHVEKIEQLAKERSIEIEDEGEMNVCDRCGKERKTTLHDGLQVCRDCLKRITDRELEKLAVNDKRFEEEGGK